MADTEFVMVDEIRARRRWLHRRFASYGLVFGALSGAVSWTVVSADVAVWLKIVFVAASVPVTVLLAWLGVSALKSVRLLAQRRGREARIIRRQLMAPAWLANLALLLMIAMLAAPPLFRGRGAAREGHAISGSPKSARKGAHRSETPIAGARHAGSEVAAMVAPWEPPHMAVVSFEADVVRGDPAAGQREDVGDGGQEAGLPEFKHALEDLIRSTAAEAVGLNRMGLPDESEAATVWPAPEVSWDLLILSSGAYERGGGTSVSFDVPVGRNDAIVTSYMAAMMADEDAVTDLHLDDLFAWQRVAVGYQRRLAGFTRRAAFDLAAGAGLAIDMFRAPEEGLDSIDSTARISPYVEMEASFWQGESFGLILHVGQTLPLNVTGATASITEFSATLRIDVSKGVSIHAGYRGFLVNLRVHDGSFEEDGGDGELDDRFAGPFIGVDLRF